MAILARMILDLCTPATLAGYAGLLALAASFYFSLERRDGDNALFCICLGWLLVVADIVYAFPHEAFRTQSVLVKPAGWSGLQAPCRFMGRLVPPLLLSMPAVWCVLRPEHERCLQKARMRIAATTVAVADALLLLSLIPGLAPPPPFWWSPPEVFAFRVLGALSFCASFYFFLRLRDGNLGMSCVAAGCICALADVAARVLMSVKYYGAMTGLGTASFGFSYDPHDALFRFTGISTEPIRDPLYRWVDVVKVNGLLTLVAAILLTAIAACCALRPGSVEGVVRNRKRVLAAMATFLHILLLLMFLVIWIEPRAFVPG